MCYKTESIWGQEIQVLKKLFEKRISCKALNAGVLREHSMNDAYISYLVDQFPLLVDMHLVGVIDCLYGATAAIIPDLIQAMGWSHVQMIHAELDGTFPLGEPDPVNNKKIEVLSQKVCSLQAQFGIAFDGDGDRMVPVSMQGKRIPGDHVLALFAESLLINNPGATVVYDTKCSQVVPEIIKACGGRPIMSPTGHSVIKSCMQETDALLGGELSCHFFFNDRYFGYDDGMYAMCRLLEHSLMTGQSLDALVAKIPVRFSTDELRIPCDPAIQPAVVMAVKDFFEQRNAHEISLLDGVRIVTSYGWALVRQSHTQPLLSARFEANSQEDLNQLQNEIKMLMAGFIDNEQLQNEFEDR